MPGTLFVHSAYASAFPELQFLYLKYVLVHIRMYSCIHPYNDFTSSLCTSYDVIQLF